MTFDKFQSPEDLWEERRKCVEASVVAVSIDELNALVKKHDDEFLGLPWREEFLRIITEQPHASFYSAAPQDDVIVYYCRDTDFGVWVVPGRGSGPLDQAGKRLMKEAIEGAGSGQKIGGKK